MASYLEEFWGHLLSRDAERTRTTFRSLKDAEERQSILAHLRRMATEDGWAEPQRISAQHALDAIQPLLKDNE